MAASINGLDLEKRPQFELQEVAKENLLIFHEDEKAVEREAMRALGLLHQWEVCRSLLHRAPTMRELAEFWGNSQRTMFRSQALFRRAFDSVPVVTVSRACSDWDRSRGLPAIIACKVYVLLDYEMPGVHTTSD
jgi:hypothetical protein